MAEIAHDRYRMSRRLWLAVGLCALATLYVLRLGWLATYPAFGDDNAIYLIGARSLAAGHGYRFINYPDEPSILQFPIGYPLLLSLVFRFMPFGPASIEIVRLMNVAVALVWIEASRRLLRTFVRPGLAAWMAIAIGLIPLAFDLVGQIMSDLLFGALTIIAINVARSMPAGVDVGPSDRARRRVIVWAVIAGLATGAAMLVRTIGFTVVLGVALSLMLGFRGDTENSVDEKALDARGGARKRTIAARSMRQWCGFAFAAAIVVLPWLVWSGFHRGGTFYTYVAQNHISWRTPRDHLTELVFDAAPAMLLAALDPQAWPSGELPELLSLIAAGMGLIVSGLIAVGWWRLLRRGDTVALVLAPYLIIVLFWWWPPERFIVPVLPLLAACGIEGVRLILRGMRRRAVAEAIGRWGLAVCIIAALVVDLRAIANVERFGNIGGQGTAANWHNMENGLAQLRATTPPDAIILSSWAASVYLFTDRRTMDIDEQTDLATQIGAAGQWGPVFIYATWRYDPTTGVEFGFAPIRKYALAHPGALIRQWQSDDAAITILRYSGNSPRPDGPASR